MMRAEIRTSGCELSDFLAETLKPETTRDISRTTVDVTVEDGDLVIRVSAGDVVALRAALNSYIRWLKLALDTKEMIGGT